MGDAIRVTVIATCFTEAATEEPTKGVPTMRRRGEVPVNNGYTEPTSAAAYEVHRIAHGVPRGGLDFIYGDAFPHETDMDQLAGIDFDKGCYVSQEPVFRVHAQGNAARALRGLVVEGGAPLAAGSPIKHPAKDNAGTVTSSVSDGDHTIALGYLHRTCWEPGGTVDIAGRRATVHDLPMVTG